MKRLAILSIVCVALSAALMVWGFAEREEAAERVPVYVALMTEDRGTSAMQFKQGAQLAADELGAELIIHAVAVSDDETESLLYLLDTLMYDSFDGLILPPCDNVVYEKAVMAAGEEKAPLVCLWDADERAARVVLTDRAEQGAQIARSILSSGIEAKAINVYSDGSVESGELMAGLVAVADEAGIPVVTWGDMLPWDDKLFGSGDVYVSLSPALTEPLCRAVGGARGVWGIDPGEARVALLEERLAAGLSMEMPFIRGYLAVQSLGSGDDAERVVFSPTRVVTRDTMYESENVKLVFPLIQ